MEKRYRVFKRSAKSFEEFAKARKITVTFNVSLERAKQLCDYHNSRLTSAQIRKGTKFEFESY